MAGLVEVDGSVEVAKGLRDVSSVEHRAVDLEVDLLVERVEADGDLAAVAGLDARAHGCAPAVAIEAMRGAAAEVEHPAACLRVQSAGRVYAAPRHADHQVRAPVGERHCELVSHRGDRVLRQEALPRAVRVRVLTHRPTVRRNREVRDVHGGEERPLDPLGCPENLFDTLQAG